MRSVHGRRDRVPGPQPRPRACTAKSATRGRRAGRCSRRCTLSVRTGGNGLARCSRDRSPDGRTVRIRVADRPAPKMTARDPGQDSRRERARCRCRAVDGMRDRLQDSATLHVDAGDTDARRRPGCSWTTSTWCRQSPRAPVGVGPAGAAVAVGPGSASCRPGRTGVGRACRCRCRTGRRRGRRDDHRGRGRRRRQPRSASGAVSAGRPKRAPGTSRSSPSRTLPAAA